MNTRSQIFGTYAVKILIAVLVLILASFLYLRLDASRNRSYSLGKATKTALRALKDKVVVKVFASDEMPQELSTLNRSLKDMLEEFQQSSRGKLKFEYVRAKNTDELIDQARQYNIPPLTATIYEEDKMVSKEIVFGVSFEGGGQSSSMYLRPGMETMLEYQLLKQVNKLQSETLPEIAMFADSLALMYQYAYYQDQVATFFSDLTENYQVQFTRLDSMPKQVPVMLCLGVADSLSTLQLYHLDQYLMKGGQLVMLQDRALVTFSSQGTSVTQTDSNLLRMLEHWGILIEPNIVLDQECELGKGGGLGTQIPYPFFPRLKPVADVPYTAGFDPIVVNIASELGLMPGSQLKMDPVLQTSGKSNRLLGPVFNIDQAVNRGLEPGWLSLPPLTVAAEYSGKFRSFFDRALTDSTFHASVDQARIILFGDSEFNLEFGAGAFITLNAIDHLLGRADMVKLRSPRITYNRLGADVYMDKHQLQPANPEKTVSRLTLGFKLTAILLPVLLLAFVGIALASKRHLGS
ncbi:MAG: Gldg family protein [Candidatus Cloacimonetes bacterium]|nr:Gldg family protein [Candidatus Cloacimonadota bacterium]